MNKKNEFIEIWKNHPFIITSGIVSIVYIVFSGLFSSIDFGSLVSLWLFIGFGFFVLGLINKFIISGLAMFGLCFVPFMLFNIYLEIDAWIFAIKNKVFV